MKRFLCYSFLAVFPLLAAFGQDDSDLLSSEIVELDPFEVRADARGIPDLIFELESPRFAYYEPPQLPRGELIVALDFIDRYREAEVPGARKWASLVYFPWIDGLEIARQEWLCFYLWDDIVYGFSPSAYYEEERRFAVNLTYENRRDPARLLAVVEAYIELVAPATEEPYYLMTGEDEDGFFEEELDFFDVPAGRLGTIIKRDQGKAPEELIVMPYEYLEDPNPSAIETGEMGRGPRGSGLKIDWADVFDFSMGPDPFETARALLRPRWSQRADIVYEKDILFFKDVRQKARVLLFNIGNKIYSYHPEYGVWRTDATLQMLQAGQGSNLITYPGGVAPKQVLILPWETNEG